MRAFSIPGTVNKHNQQMQSSAVELQAGEAQPSPRSLSLCRPMCGDPWPLLGRARPPNGLPAFITVPCSDEDVIMDLGACVCVRYTCVRPHHQRYVHMFTSVWSTQAGGCCVQGAVCRARWHRIRRCVLLYVSTTVFLRLYKKRKYIKKTSSWHAGMILINHTINSRTPMQRHSQVDITLFFFNKQYT